MQKNIEMKVTEEGLEGERTYQDKTLYLMLI